MMPSICQPKLLMTREADPRSSGAGERIRTMSYLCDKDTSELTLVETPRIAKEPPVDDF
jgi:hypothetical protein